MKNLNIYFFLSHGNKMTQESKNSVFCCKYLTEAIKNRSGYKSYLHKKDAKAFFLELL